MKENRKSKRWIWILGIIMIFAASGGYTGYRYWYLPGQELAVTETEIQTAAARRGDITLYASGSGTLVAAREVEVGFDLSDGVQEELIELNIKVGDKVEEGDILGKLDDSDRQDALTAAQRTLRELTSDARLAELQQELANNQIDRDDNINNLIGLISLPVYQAENLVEKYALALEEAQAAAAENTTEENDTLLESAEQNLKWAESNLASQWDYYEEEYLPENFEDFYWDSNDNRIYFIDAPTEAEIQSKRAAIYIAEANIQELEILIEAIRTDSALPEEATGTNITELRNAREAVEDTLSDLEATYLIAPISGTVTEVNLEVSELVSNETALVISVLTPPTLEAYFDESDWNSIQEGFPVEVIFDALPDDTYSGEVTHVDPGLISQSNSTVIYSVVELDTSESGWDGLPVGSAAGVDVIGGKTENAVLVPIEALRKISEDEYAVFVIEDGEPKMKMVEVGLQDLIYAEIISGLEAGDTVSTGQVETNQ
jgi:multidrug efflux pump subunit AcrA (membrane-fusion protein)